VRVGEKPRRVPWYALVVYGVAAAASAVVFPLRRMWRSDRPIDAYALVHFASVAGDTLLGVALADSVFFSLPVDEATAKVAQYLGLTMLPLALAGPLLVPLLDRSFPRRAISLAASGGRALVAVYLAPRLGDAVVFFPAALVLLVGSKVHAIVKNGLTVSYAPAQDGLMRTNARLGRVAVGGAVAGFPIGFAFLKLFGAAGSMYAATVAYGVAALLNLRLPRPRRVAERREVGPRGSVTALAGAAIGAAGLRAASGFLLFLLGFALRREGQPTWWFGLLAAAGVLGGFLADLISPRISNALREERVVVGCVLGAGAGALIAYNAFSLPVLVVFGLLAGASTEFGRLAFQSLMQRHAPEGAYGRVFVRYEVVFQVSWVIGAFLPAVLPLGFRGGMLVLAGFYSALATLYFLHERREERRPEPA
jgi:hypothetical protein